MKDKLKRGMCKVAKIAIISLASVAYSLIDEIERGNMECKCKGCTERHVGCHEDCEHYNEFRQRLDEQNKQKKEDSMQLNLTPKRKYRRWK